MSVKSTGQKVKLLIVADSHVAATEQAHVIRLIFGGLLEHFPSRYEINQVGLNHYTSTTEPMWPIYPTESNESGEVKVLSEGDRFGQMTFPKVYEFIKPDIVLVIGELPLIQHLFIEKNHRDFKLVVMVTVDSVPLPDFEWRLSPDRLVTLSEFAWRALKHSRNDTPEERSSVLYCPANTNSFYPSSVEDRLESRESFFPNWIPSDAFVFGCVLQQNDWREQVWLVYKVVHYLRTGGYLECLDCGRVSLFNWNPSSATFEDEQALVPEARPDFRFQTCSHCRSTKIEVGSRLDDVFLCLHMPSDNAAATWPLEMMERQFDMQPGRDVFYSGGRETSGLVVTDLPTLYRQWDALLYLTGGADFGLPPWQAMCTAIPVVYTNYASSAEFLGRANAGIGVGGLAVPTPKKNNLLMIAKAVEVVEAALKLYRNRELGKELGSNGLRFVQNYDMKSQVRRWDTLFHETLKKDE